MFRLFLVTFLCCCVGLTPTIVSKAGVIIPCTRKNLGECAVKEANRVVKIIAKGIPEAGLPDVTNYKYPAVVYKGPDVEIKYRGGITTGLEGFEAHNITFDFDNQYVYELDKFPSLELNGTYEIDGKIFDTPIKATGPFNISMVNIDLYYEMKFEFIIKDGEEYMHKLYHTIIYKPETVKVNFENLFDDAERTAKFNQKINDDKERCVQEIVPSVAKLLEDYSDNYLYTNIINRTPFNQLILPE